MRNRLAWPIVVVVLGSMLPLAPASAGGYCRGTEITDARGTTVEMKKACYTPSILRVDKGAEVTFVNRDFEPHTVTGANSSWGTDHSELEKGDVASFRFADEGVYAYTCLLHPGMIGVVVVGDGAGPGAGKDPAVRSVSVSPPEVHTGSEESSEDGSDSDAVAAAVPGDSGSDDDGGSVSVLALTAAGGAGAGITALAIAFRRRRGAGQETSPTVA